MSDISFVPDLTGAQLLPDELSGQLPDALSEHALVVVDGTVDDIDTLTANLQAEVVVIDPAQDGLAAITAALSARSQTDSLHILSHGSAATLQLGSTLLNRENLSTHAAQIQQWQSLLGPHADVLFYGCNIGFGTDGEAFVQQLAQLTGADVAASDDLTGQGGDWRFEITVGEIETASIIGLATQAAYDSTLATYNGHEYQLTNGAKTWEQAQAEAESLGGYLVTVNDAAESNWLRQTFSSTEDLWIGLTDKAQEGSFRWINGEPVTYTPWGAGEPNDYGSGEDYAAMNFGDRNEWNDWGSSTRLRGIIEIGDGGGDPGPDPGNGNGLTGTYYNNRDFTAQTLTRVDPTVDFDWGGGSPATSMGNNTFSVRWQGQIEPLYSETYTFRTTSDDGVRLWVNGQQIIDQFIDQAPTNHTGQITLQAGQKYDIRMDYYENGGGAVAKLAWSSPSQPLQIVPQSQLYSGGGNGSPGAIALSAGSLSVDESVGTVEVDVVRNQGSTGTVTVDYQTVNGSAKAGSDYTSQSGTLTFASGQTRQTISVLVSNDTQVEDAEDFAITIDNVTGGAALLAPRTTKVTIQDNDGGGNPTYNGHEYRLTSDAKTWEQAQAEAESLGGYLVTVNAAAESNWLRQTFSDTEDLWIGLTDKVQEGSFRWINGEPVTYTPWGAGEPNDYGSGEDYAAMNFGDRNEWNDWGSSTRLRGIIEIGDGGGDPGPDPGNGDGLTGTYYNNRDFTAQTLTRVDPTVDFDWGGGSPAASMGNNTFSVRWQGQIEPLYSETYTFRTTSDDGVRLWVNGQQIIDQFIDQAPTNHTGQITLQAGQKYDIRMDYYENSGGAVAKLAWSSASQPLQIVPQSQLYFDGGGSNPPKTLNKQDLVSGLVQPTDVDWLPGQDKMLIAEQRGVVKLRENGTLSSTPFIDISSQVNGTRDRGLLDIAVHPNFPQNPYVYMLFTYDPPQVYENASHPLAGPDKNGNRAGRLIRVTADASNGYRTAVSNSEVVLLGKNSTWNNFNAFVDSTVNFSEAPAGIRPDGTNVQDFIATDSQSHTVGGLEFGKDGNLYVSIGDGTSYNRMDPRTVRVQDIDNLSGKILRIDPITGQGVSDNPFYNGNANANRSKVYQYGVRNPFRTTVHPDTGRLYIGDVGWNSWEEINTGSAGSNFGWPFYEGGKTGSLRTSNYEDLPEAQAFYASGQTVTAPFLGLSHASDNINAIVMGDVYTGNTYPDEYQGDLFYSELYTGRVRNVSFDANGNIADIDTFTTGANVVVQIAMGPDGNLYYVDLDDGTVGRWVFS